GRQIADTKAAVRSDLGRSNAEGLTRAPPDSPGLHARREPVRPAMSAMAEGCHVAAPTALFVAGSPCPLAVAWPTDGVVVRRIAMTCSIDRRSSSSPDGSNSYDQSRARSGREKRLSTPLAIASRDG